MKRLTAILAMILVAVVLTGSIAAAEARPEFRLGFKALADQIPEIVGDPMEDEHYGENGDSLQMTTTGLMAWRKADNWTAYTNGYHTWVNGPFGVQDRDNSERFDWEAKDALTAASPATPPAAPAPAPPATTAANITSLLRDAIQQLMDDVDGSDNLSDLEQVLER